MGVRICGVWEVSDLVALLEVGGAYLEIRVVGFEVYRYSPEQLIGRKGDNRRDEPLKPVVTDPRFHHKTENYVQHGQDEYWPGGTHQIEEFHILDVTPYDTPTAVIDASAHRERATSMVWIATRLKGLENSKPAIALLDESEPP